MVEATLKQGLLVHGEVNVNKTLPAATAEVAAFEIGAILVCAELRWLLLNMPSRLLVRLAERAELLRCDSLSGLSDTVRAGRAAEVRRARARVVKRAVHDACR